VARGLVTSDDDKVGFLQVFWSCSSSPVHEKNLNVNCAGTYIKIRHRKLEQLFS
jgi:hypothetical protein